MKSYSLLANCTFIRLFLGLGIFLFQLQTLMAQDLSITGNVTDSQGQPLPGVSILVKGTSTGTQTDFDGNFSLMASSTDTLIFSYIGFVEQQIPVGSQSVINVSMKEDVSQLDEVVLVGYGAQKKEEVTSAITKVSAEDFNAGNVNNVQQLLQGKVAGLNISRVGGNPNQPFEIRLRGLSTFGANSSPLVIIDDVIGGSLSSVDPNDIESIDVLKDASAGAIYGTRGSSGVIIITTKAGKGLRKPTLELNSYVALESLTNIIEIANREQFLENGGTDLGFDTNWLDEASRTAVSTVHNISYSGGSDNGFNYLASVNYRDVEGVTRNTGFEQLNARLNLTQKLFDDKLKLTAIVSVTDVERNIGFNQALRYALTFNPTAPVFENRSADQLGRDPNLFGGYFETGVQDVFNPVSIVEQATNDSRESVLLANFKAELRVLEGWTVSTNFSRQISNNTGGSYFPSTSIFGGAAVNGRASKFAGRGSSQLFEAITNYKGEVGGFNYEVLGGYSFQKFENESLNGFNSDFITDEVGYDNLGLGTGIIDLIAAGVGSGRSESKLSAVLGRFNLNFKNAAFLSTSIRSEESSRFGPNERRGNFWAVSGGVNLDQIVDIPSTDLFKLRAGYGITGNEPSQLYEYLERLGRTGAGFVDGEFVAGIGPVSNPNPDLKWEEKAELNLGLDFSFFNGKISGAVDYFNRTTNDLLNRINVPSPPNLFTSTVVNLGELETDGFEAQVNVKLFDKDDFQWTLGGNIATFETTLVELNDQEDFEDFRGNLGAPGLNGITPIIVREGEVLGQIRAGIFAGYNEDGESLIINQETGEPTLERNLLRDGVVVGNGLPDFTFGINNTFNYKNWDFNFFLRGAVGHSLVNVPRAYWEHASLSGRQNFVLTKYFNELDTQQDAYHSGYVEKGDFVRLDNATLGYNLKVPNSFIENLRFYISGNNLFTITGYSGSDPEVRYSDPGPITEGNSSSGFGGDILVPGMDRRVSALPTKTITVGLNVKF